MSVTQSFKKYQRGQRVQTTAVAFDKGMSFTNAPLEDGWTKLCVNFDLGYNTNNQAISPRKGMTVTSDGLIQYTSNPLPFQGPGIITDGMSIVAGNRVTRNGIEYKQIIVGRITDGPNSDRYTGDAWVLTVQGSTVQYSTLSDPTYRCYFTKPKLTNAHIHGIPLNDSEYIKKHIGVFAFNGDYYYFTNDGNLRCTQFNDTLKKFESIVVTPFAPYISEAKNSLYNMLLPNPYDALNPPGVTAAVMPLGMQAYFKDRNTGDRKLKLLPKSGEAYSYRLWYSYPAASATSVVFHISYLNNWDGVERPVVRDETQEYTADGSAIYFDDIQIDTDIQTATFMVYCLPAADATFNNGVLDTLSLAKATVGTFPFKYTGQNLDSSKNLEPVNYNLAYAKGMTYWKNRIFLYGARDDQGRIDATILWASDPNRPDWFPYPGNIDIFEEDIIYVQPMLDSLLVFTAHNLYSLTLAQDGLSWLKQHLQGNLNIAEWDLHLIQIVKNMVFFKSGNYYYMVVPKLSSNTLGISVAPVSKPIVDFLDSFEDNILQIVDDLYNYSLGSRYKSLAKTILDINLVHYYTFLDYQDMHCTYVFKATKRTKTAFDIASNTFIEETSDEVLLNLSLLYNTVTRTWRMYIQESERVLQPLFMDATGKGTYATLVEFEGNACVQLLEYSGTRYYDLYIKQGQNTATRAKLFNNWQYFDTGNMEQNSDMKKRFREYQFKINNQANNALEFYTGFFIDRTERTYEMLYRQEEVPDQDEDIRTIVIDASPAHRLQAEFFADNWTTLGKWILGVSKFPNKLFWKIRIPTSGKGYLPRSIFISYNETAYEVISHTTVYRELYSR